MPHPSLPPLPAAPTKGMPACDNGGLPAVRISEPEPGMSISIRDVREHEPDSVLALNNAAGPAILPLDAARLRRFHADADYFRVAERDGVFAGFLVGFASGSRHDSSNFRWFAERYPDFFYIDRI